MSSPSKKRERAASPEPSPSPAKKPKLLACDISATLSPGLHAFPLELRKSIEEDHISTLRRYVMTLENGTAPPSYKETYSIFTGSRTRPSSPAFKFGRRKRSYSVSSIANIELLKIVAPMLPPKPRFVPLDVAGADKMTNLELIELHAVRAGEVGFAIDRHGCASFFLADRSAQELRERVIFVEKKIEIKFEDDEVEFLREEIKQG